MAGFLIMANKYDYLARNTIIFAISTFGTKLISFLLVPFYTNVLSTKDYGTADIIATTSNLLIFAVTICIADSVMRFSMDGKERRYGVFRYGIEVMLWGCCLAGIGIGVFAFFNPTNWKVAYYILLYLTLISTAFQQLVMYYLRAIGRVVSVAVIGVITTLITVICNFVFLLGFKLGVEGYLLSFIVGCMFSVTAGFIDIYIHEKECFTQLCDENTKKMMVRYSLPLIVNGLAWWINGSIDRYFIILFKGVTVNGIYAVSSKISTIIIVVNQIFGQAWSLSAIQEYYKEDKEVFYSQIYKLYNAIITITCSLLIILNIPLARLMYANDFFEAWKYSAILVISTLFSALCSFLGSIFIAVKNSKTLAASVVVAAIVNIVLNTILIPVMGATGAAIATVISFAFMWLMRFKTVKSYMRLKVNLIKDLIVYVLLIVQMILGKQINHVYGGQALICVLIVFLYRNEFLKFLKRINRMLTHTKVE